MGTPQSIGILGGTGPHGRGLGLRLAAAGHTVVLGSRDAARAQEAAAELADRLDDPARLTGAANQQAVDATDLVIVAVPYDGLDATLAAVDGLAGRIVISCVNPLAFGRGGPQPVAVEEGSAAQRIAAVVPDARVVAAFHHLSAPGLLEDDELHDETVLVVGDDDEAKATVAALAEGLALRGGLDAGPLRLARQLEEWTAVLISINRIHKARSGIAVTGLH